MFYARSCRPGWRLPVCSSAILLANQLSRVLGQAADNQYGRHVVFDLIALGAIMNFSVIVPVSMLLAVVLTLGRLYHDSEMAALQACGFGPARLLPPLMLFAAVIAVGLGWLTFFQVPAADKEVQLLRQSAIKEAQFGQLDAGRFRSFSGGDAVFYAERVDEDGVLHNVFVQRQSAGRIEVALADSATYTKGAADGTHLVTLYNGRRYEGEPGRADFRVIEFREHGIPIITPTTLRWHHRSRHQADSRAAGFARAVGYRAAGNPQLRTDHAAAADDDRGAFEPAQAAPGPLCALGRGPAHIFFLFESAVGGESLGRQRHPAAG